MITKLTNSFQMQMFAMIFTDADDFMMQMITKFCPDSDDCRDPCPECTSCKADFWPDLVTTVTTHLNVEYDLVTTISL